jgi:3-oxoacyl-[acyl-carrier protein] reductase
MCRSRGVVERALAEGDTMHVLARTVGPATWPAQVRTGVGPAAVTDPAAVAAAALPDEPLDVHRGGRLRAGAANLSPLSVCFRRRKLPP